MMNEFEGKLEKLTRLTKAFEQADDSNKRSHLANELLCTLENTTLSARRYYSSFLKPEKHGRETHILPYHVEEHCAVEVTRDGWTHIRLNTLLQSTHLGLQGRLVTYSGRHTAKQRRYLRTSLGETEDVINEQQHILTTFDPDNKEWKCVTNALKGVLFEDDDSRTVSLILDSIPDGKGFTEVLAVPYFEMKKTWIGR